MKRHIVPIIALVILLAFPLAVQNFYYQGVMILVLMWVVIGSGWNLISGFTGQVLFGAAVFFGIGAYTSALLLHKLEISAWWGFPLGALVSFALAFPFGWICFRLRGPYFALATLALNEIMRHIATIWESLTEGMVGILVPQTFDSKIPYYYIALFLAVASVVVVDIMMRSRIGYYFVSIREDQDAAESLGINTTYYKMVSLCISAVFIGLTGALYTNYMGFIDPHIVFSLHNISIMAILVGIVGGVGTVHGPAVGAFIMVLVDELFRSGGFGLLSALGKSYGWGSMTTVVKYVSEAHTLVFGVIVILVILYLPNGVVGDWPVIKRFIFRGRQAD
ncbi:MAG: branched-chain amino acid ABC transporter permease [Pseudomonadota bacterium]